MPSDCQTLWIKIRPELDPVYLQCLSVAHIGLQMSSQKTLLSCDWLLSIFKAVSTFDPFVFGKPNKGYFVKQWRPRWNATLCCISSGSTLFVKVKKSFRQKNTIFFGNYNLTPLDMYNGLSKFIVSNQKEESISIQRVNETTRVMALLGHSTNMSIASYFSWCCTERLNTILVVSV